MSRVPSAALVAALVLLPASTAGAADYSGTALNIIPSGQPGGFPVPAGADTQAHMYDALTPLAGQVTSGDLLADFKSEKFGAADSCPCRTERVPRVGITITRDRFDVPHITGRDRIDLDWAAGWVTEEDRGLLLAQGRYPARFAALDAPGVDAFSLVTGLKQVTVTKQADKLIDSEQTAALRKLGGEGRGVLRDIDAYVDGVNARLRSEKSRQRPWTRVDVYALNALAGQIFGQGGGDEVRRSMLLSGLRKRLGDAQGTTLWNDLSEHLDGDTPTTMSKRFPYESIKAPAPGSAVVDAGSTSASARSAFRATAARSRPHASNFLMVAGKRSSNGHPLFVAGPQIGYFYPGLTLELDLKAPGIQARGAAMPGGAGNILIGRGPDYAWSLTSAGSDTNDQFIETLCGGSSTRYRYKGTCRSMGTVDAGSIKGQGRVRYRTTVHGPVQGYATVGGKRVAISFKRSSHGKDVLWQVMFKRMTDGVVHDVKSFDDAAATSPFTFNVAYADDRHIAAYSAGRLPLRDPRVDPRLPTRGTGEYEWRGYLSENGHPHQADPASGVLVNWNNKPAPAFGASDAEWSYGSIQRVLLLDAGLAARPVHDLPSVVGAMNKAATQDLRAAGSVLPAIAGVLATGPAPSAREQRMLDLLLAWRAAGANRLDRDGDGKMDAGGAPAIMDAVYPRIADAVLQPVLGPQLGELSTLEGQTNGAGSGFTGGRIQYVDKDLRQLLGERFRTPLATRFCGGGDLAACRTSLWQAFKDAGDALAAAQGTDSPDAWTSDANAERISFAPGLLTTTIRYTNRPSGIQQVISFSGHRGRKGSR
jgi:acyl-homoserine lactone acylase PvdQ